MVNKELHTQKVTILSRLIKESSLTLEEALLLLREEAEEEQKVEEPNPYYSYTYSTGNIGISTITPSNKMTIGPTETMSFGSITTNTLIADNSADLNT
jgi:hypothetical protein